MHRLLLKQIKRIFPDREWSSDLNSLLNVISETYNDLDNERMLLERSLELVSEELNLRNIELKKKLQQLNETNDQLNDSMAVLDSIFDATGEAIFAFDNKGELIRTNQASQDIFDFASFIKQNKSPSIGDLLSNILVKNSVFTHELRKLQSEPKMDLFGVVELTNQRLLEYHTSPQLSKDQLVGRVWCFRDVTQIKKNESLVQHQAYHDALTNLPNRTLFLDRIKNAIALSHRRKELIAILFLDLDHFKKVNDTAGHQVGDALLIEVAIRIKSIIRDHDTLARFGGDEFVVLLANINSHRDASQTSIRIIEQLQLPFHIEGKEFHISASIGISLCPNDDSSPDELIRKADLAMYHAKENGRSHFEFFAAPLERIALFQLELENRLRVAVENQELCVYYQPLVDTKTLNVSKMEALLRWLPETGSPISPTDFIPVAERAGLIIEIGYWVIEQVCLNICQWKKLGINDIRVSINLSARQFNDENLFMNISQIISRTGVEGKNIEFEITESMLVENLHKVVVVLQELRALDITVAIDDFGTGYSSLKYLQKLPIDNIKIDRTFVSDLSSKPENQSIVKAIISLGHNLNLKVVAEGVEDQLVYEYLEQLDCDYIQGFYFYKPMPSADIIRLLCN